MEPGLDEGASGGHRAGDLLGVERALGAKRDLRRSGLLAEPRLDRRLDGLEAGAVHRPPMVRRQLRSAARTPATAPATSVTVRVSPAAAKTNSIRATSRRTASATSSA